MINDAREDHWTEKVFRRAWLILLNTAAGAVMAIVATVIVCADDPAKIVSAFVLCV